MFDSLRLLHIISCMAPVETGTELKIDPENSGCLIEWLQRLGMVTTLGKISTSLPGLSSLIDSIEHLKIRIFLSLVGGVSNMHI